MCIGIGHKRMVVYISQMVGITKRFAQVGAFDSLTSWEVDSLRQNNVIYRL